MPPPYKQHVSGMISIQNDANKNTAYLWKSRLVEYIPRHNLQKKIQPSATRFPSEKSLTSNIWSNVNGIFQEEIDSDSDSDYTSSTTGASTDLDAPLRPVEEERLRFQRKQKLNRLSYVTMTPQIIPGAGNESLITRWGNVDGTPITLSGRDEKTESSLSSLFRIPPKNERECAANKAELLLARRAKLSSSSSSSKIKKRRASNEGKRPGSLTPAALSLLKKTKSKRPRIGGAFVSALRTSYTPRHHPSSSYSLKHSLRDSKSRQRDHAYNATPQA